MATGKSYRQTTVDSLGSLEVVNEDEGVVRYLTTLDIKTFPVPSTIGNGTQKLKHLGLGEVVSGRSDFSCDDRNYNEPSSM